MRWRYTFIHVNLNVVDGEEDASRKMGNSLAFLVVVAYASGARNMVTLPTSKVGLSGQDWARHHADEQGMG
jgi:5-carboxymethyl-2-hydroxymuconate isomerase